MARFIDLVGQKFGRLTVVERSAVRKSSGALWSCVCECGGKATVNSLKLRTGHTASCGCLKVEAVPNLRHGYSGTRTHRSWKEMRQRCLNPKSDKWQWYGGRGISVCAEWDDFEQFLIDMGERPIGMTLDRIDSDGNYKKDNCRWANPKQQAETNRGVFKAGRTANNITPQEVIDQMRLMKNQGAKLKEIAAVFHKNESVISGLINHGPRTLSIRNIK